MANHDSIMQIKGSPKPHSGCRLHLGTLAFSLLLGFGSALIVPAAAAAARWCRMAAAPKPSAARCRLY
ncbi:hypothetical protein [Neisseria bergeri]|uniref:hypothetical protein n=1 Tax=Neisseria bergeri TaxID=1906581 RepID=UPI00186494E5|nr:hypothetical protein [Neisseria bergeri]